MSDPFSDPNASPWSRSGDPVGPQPQGWQQPPSAPSGQGWQQPPQPAAPGQGWQDSSLADQPGWGQPPPPGQVGWGQQPQGWPSDGGPGQPPFGHPPGAQKSNTIVWIILAVVVVLVLGIIGAAIAVFSAASTTVDTVIENLQLGPAAGVPEGPRLLESTGSIGSQSVQRYEFTVPDRTTVQIDVIGIGSFDPIVTLFDGGTQIGSDDDGGAGLNSRLRQELSSGTYIAEVTGFGSGTGDFQIVITDL